MLKDFSVGFLVITILFVVLSGILVALVVWAPPPPKIRPFNVIGMVFGAILWISVAVWYLETHITIERPYEEN